MDSNQIRDTFFEFFRANGHKIVASAPMVIKNDPTLMFTNAGMNQFKDIFLGNSSPVAQRVANTQKCLRVSGKHNDLDEVGHDTYHHTMFEMLGNWSFGDYFKKEAIEWAWELLTAVYKINKDNLYVTVFGGSDDDGLTIDKEAFDYWKNIVPEERIILGSKKDNFWEMGDTGPCGPCSEIHIDLRDPAEKDKIKGAELVNKDHPGVIEIWNLVFIEFNRKSDGSLEPLPAKHVDTGMGFERLTMVLQGKKSNYDTDIFQDIIQKIAGISGISYGADKNSDVAMRVVADHLRAIVFAIADGQLPSNVKAGYVIRRILRRAVRYGYTFLGMHEPFMHMLIPVLVSKMSDVFNEIKAQQDLISKVILEEESAFLRTLSAGIKKFEQYLKLNPENMVIDGSFAFELFDTYGFPIDLTQLMAKEQGRGVDMDGFKKGLEAQKDRSRQAATRKLEDWVVVNDEIEKTEFLGYETLTAKSHIVKFRKISDNKGTYFQVILDRTPFYAESGGQVGDRGILKNETGSVKVEDTQKENDLIIHIVKQLPEKVEVEFEAIVDHEKRVMTANNHSATHLMHAALRKVLGTHVEQKGSLVDENHLRFDFSHFAKLKDEEILQIENIVNEKIRQNIPLHEKQGVPMEDAIQMGAMALFGEKYGEHVRVIIFDENYSVELCGGTHVPATGQIGLFKIISESAIAAGVRRIEAITAKKTEVYVQQQEAVINQLKTIFKSQTDIVKGVQTLIDENQQLQKQLAALTAEKVENMKESLLQDFENVNGIYFLARKTDLDNAANRDLAFKFKKEFDDVFVILGSEINGKASLTLMISGSLVDKKGMDAGKIIREIAKEINGGGGGQTYFAIAGGSNPGGIDKAFAKAREIVSKG